VESEESGRRATTSAEHGSLSSTGGHCCPISGEEQSMIRKLKSGEYRLYSRKKDPSTGKRRNLGTFASRAAAERHERAVQFFKRH
jgi:hypothetical protein